MAESVMGGTTGADNQVALQAAMDALAGGGQRRLVIPSHPLGLGFRVELVAGTISTAGEVGDPNISRLGVSVPSNVTIQFMPGAFITTTKTGGRGPLFLCERTENVTFVSPQIYGTCTSYATMGSAAGGVMEYRSVDTRIIAEDHRSVFGGLWEPLLGFGSVTRNGEDTSHNFLLDGATFLDTNAVGPHMFGGLQSPHVRDVIVMGTQHVDAMQWEQIGDYETASENALVEDIDIRSAAMRGFFINPENYGFRGRRIKVRNPGRLSDGTIIGYDQNAPANPHTNAPLSVFGSEATFTDLDLADALDINPGVQPAVSWSRPGYNLMLDGVTRISIDGFKSENCPNEDIQVRNFAGVNITEGDRVEIRRAERPVTVAYRNADEGAQAVFNTALVVTERVPKGSGTAVAPLVNLLPAWNPVGPDGAICSWFSANAGLTVTADTADKLVGFGSVHISEATTTNDSYQLQVPGHLLSLGVGGVVNLLMLARFNAPAENFAWTVGGLSTVAQRALLRESKVAQDYRAGEWRWIHSQIAIPAGTALGNNVVRIWPSYANAAVLDIDINAIWVQVGPDAQARPEFDLERPMTTNSTPTLGTWQAGQRLRKSLQTAGGYEAMVCTAGGTPGTWKNAAAILA